MIVNHDPEVEEILAGANREVEQAATFHDAQPRGLVADVHADDAIQHHDPDAGRRRPSVIVGGMVLR